MRSDGDTVSDDMVERAREIADNLTERQRMVVLNLNGWSGWLSAEDTGFPGVTLNALSNKGCLDRRSDPRVWGRGQYRVLPLGFAVRAALSEPREAV